MKRYKVCASYITHVYTYVEADSLEEAHDIADELDGGEFMRDKGDDLSDWSINMVMEVTNA
jgi:hypothetical protein